MTSDRQAPPSGHPRDAGNDNHVSEEELQAYVDGQLPPDERVRIESYLASNPGESERLEAYRKQNIGLHALFDSPRFGPGQHAPARGAGDLADIPPALAAKARQLDRQISAANKPALRFRSLAAGLALLVAAGGAGWMAHERFSEPNDPLVAFTRQAAEAHARLAGFEPAQSGADNEDGRQFVAWLSEQAAGTALTVPDLESLGFRLVADRVMPAATGKRAAQLLYQDSDGQRITLYMRAGYRPAGREAVETSFTFRREGQVSQFFWQHGGFAYSLIGMMEQKRLLEIAEVVSKELERDVREAGTLDASAGEDRTGPSAPLTLPGNAADTIDAGQKINAEPDEGAAIKATEPSSEPMPATPELLPLKPLPLPEAESAPKET